MYISREVKWRSEERRRGTHMVWGLEGIDVLECRGRLERKSMLVGCEVEEEWWKRR